MPTKVKKVVKRSHLEQLAYDAKRKRNPPPPPPPGPRKTDSRKGQLISRPEPPRIVYELGDLKTWNYKHMHRDLIFIRALQAFQDVTGVPKQLMGKGFEKRAREVLNGYYPTLLASAARRMLMGTRGTPTGIVHLPLTNTNRFDNCLLFLDLMETMRFVEEKRRAYDEIILPTE